MYPQVCYKLKEKGKPFYTMSANRPGWSKMANRGDIIVAGRNFGTGSSRPAADNIKNLGISCVIAESINGLFLRNSVNSGFLALTVPGIVDTVDEGDILYIDLKNNTVINKSNNRKIVYRPLPGFLMDIIENGGIINILRNKGLLGGPL
jgi:3-isopropylmalate/(R)-2-methylmalate dehydratase small subunit